MGDSRATPRKDLRGWYQLSIAALVVACGACSFLLDRNATQCTTDADCAALGFHTYCQVGVCTNSGLGPSKPQCFFGAPSQPDDFLNQCSTGFLPDPTPTSTCVNFDDCARLGVCNNNPPSLEAPDGGAAAADAGQTTVGSLVPCSNASLGGAFNVVYVTGSSNFPNVLKEVAPVIQGSQPNVSPGPNPVFLTTNSCTAVKTMFGADHTIRDPPAGSALNKYAFYFDGSNNQVYCTLGSGGAQLDVGESDVYSSTCDPTLTAGGNSGVLEGLGPVQAMAFVVPTSSSEVSISHEAAREVFGIGGNAQMAKPWIDPSLYFVRNKNTGTQQMIALELGIDPNQFWGIDQGSANNVHDGLVSVNGSLVASEAIGIISVDVYDADRINLRALAYQETGQDCAYLPDSTPDSKDKQNVRDGHYPIWGPLHFYSPLMPTTDNSRAFLSFVAGYTQLQALIDAFIRASVVPPCAMQVQRDQNTELGTLSTLPPSQQSCGCYFETQTRKDQPPTRGCNACKSTADCVSGRACSILGFCELDQTTP
ncbi:MAG TPA: hypothetical protein VGM06_08900 [Polyangiaceae bacterium]|jgi:hypothetical protein